MFTQCRTAVALVLAMNTMVGGGSAALSQDAAVVLNTPDEGKVPRPMQCHARSLDDAARATVQRLAQIRGTNERRAEVASASAASRHTFQEWEAVACDLLQQKRLTPQQYVSLVDDVLPLLAPSAPLPRPELLEPKGGGVHDHYPRRLSVTWKPVTDAVQYLVEVQYRNLRPERAGDGSMRLEDAGWAPHNDGLHSASVLGAGATFHFIGAQRGRVRSAGRRQWRSGSSVVMARLSFHALSGSIR